jgi:SsrA-binding protein
LAKKKEKEQSETIAENRKARFDYAIEETLECGIILQGSEVRSVRDKQVSITEGYVSARQDPPELTLHNVNIGEFAHAAHNTGHRPKRTRALLAHKKEILKLAAKMAIKGYTIVPLTMYFKNGYAKVLVGVGKGKSRVDKRQSIGAREAKRDMDRALSRRRNT